MGSNSTAIYLYLGLDPISALYFYSANPISNAIFQCNLADRPEVIMLLIHSELPMLNYSRL